MDVKTGVYAFVRIAGFYIDTNWIGKAAPGTDMTGLYWGLKNLVAMCRPCDPCLGTWVNDLLDVAASGFNWGVEKVLAHELKESNTVGKEKIDTLDLPMPGEDMPTGHLDTACYAEYSGKKMKKRFDDDVECEEEKDGEEAKMLFMWLRGRGFNESVPSSA